MNPPWWYSPAFTKKSNKAMFARLTFLEFFKASSRREVSLSSAWNIFWRYEVSASGLSIMIFNSSRNVSRLSPDKSHDLGFDSQSQNVSMMRLSSNENWIVLSFSSGFSCFIIIEIWALVVRKRLSKINLIMLSNRWSWSAKWSSNTGFGQKHGHYWPFNQSVFWLFWTIPLLWL